MSRLFDPHSPLMELLSRAFDHMAVSLLALLCALPVVTAGASAAALYAVSSDVSNGGSGGAQAFWLHLRQSGRAGRLWLTLPAALLVLAADLPIIASMSGAFRLFFGTGVSFLALSLLLGGVFFIPLAVAAPNASWKTLWKRALFLGIARLPHALAVLAALALPPVMLALWPRWFFALGFLWIFYYPAALAGGWVRLTKSAL